MLNLVRSPALSLRALIRSQLLAIKKLINSWMAGKGANDPLHSQPRSQGPLSSFWERG